MKYGKLMLATLAIATVLPTLAVGQMPDNGGKIVAQVPFEFVVANKVVPAGRYAVQAASLDEHALLISSQSAKVSLFTSDASDESKLASSQYILVFKTYGDQHFLSEIRMKDSHVVYRLPESKAERELHAQSIPATEETLLATLRR